MHSSGMRTSMAYYNTHKEWQRQGKHNETLDGKTEQGRLTFRHAQID